MIRLVYSKNARIDLTLHAQGSNDIEELLIL